MFRIVKIVKSIKKFNFKNLLILDNNDHIVGVTLKTDGWDEVNFGLNSAMEWLRENSDNFESSRLISLAIRGLIAGGDPPKAHHIQRLVTKLRNKQYNTDDFMMGSWSGEVTTTANALIALHKASLTSQPDPRKVDYLDRGLNFLEKCYDKKLGNWFDMLPETIASCQSILELDDLEKQKKCRKIVRLAL